MKLSYSLIFVEILVTLDERLFYYLDLWEVFRIIKSVDNQICKYQ